jgi:hypothetical protein
VLKPIDSIPSLLAGWESAPAYLFQQQNGTVPVTAGGQVCRNRVARYGLGTQSDVAGMVYKSRPDNLAANGASGLSYPDKALISKFTAYFIGTRLDATSSVPFGNATTTATIQWKADNRIYFYTDTAREVDAPLDGNGRVQVRVRRDAANHVWVAKIGSPEIDMGIRGGTATFNLLGAVGSVFTSAGNNHEAEYLFGDDLVTTGEDAAIMVPYISTKFV